MGRRDDYSRQGDEHRGLDALKPVQKRDEELEVLGDLDELMDEDLREFVAADALPCNADPGFRERLREKLWELVERNARGAPALAEAAAGDEETGDD